MATISGKLFSNVIFCRFKLCHNRKKSPQHLFMTWLTFTTYLCFFLAILCPIFWNLPEKTSFWNPLLNFYDLENKAFHKKQHFCTYIFTKLFGHFMNQKSGKLNFKKILEFRNFSKKMVILILSVFLSIRINEFSVGPLQIFSESIKGGVFGVNFWVIYLLSR